MTSSDSASRFARPMRMILILALAPAIGLGIGRFAYSLVLPDMRDALGWSYSTAGFMNTINAIGYLAGALGAASFIRRVGLFRAAWIGALACVVSLAICAVSGNVIIFSLGRILSGLGAAATFVAGGALTAGARPNRGPCWAAASTGSTEKNAAARPAAAQALSIPRVPCLFIRLSTSALITAVQCRFP